MTRLFGIAGVQMAVVPWDAEATVKKMDDTVHQIARRRTLIGVSRTLLVIDSRRT